MTSVPPSQTQISDFFGSYPQIDINTPTNQSIFNTLIAKKAEFNELQSSPNEPIPPRGEGFLHQKFAVRYLTWYDRLLLLHDPGTGKSCIITHSAELFKNSYLKDPNDPTKIRQAVILVRGPTLTENIKHQIVCKCTDRVYETEKVLQSQNESTMKSNLTRELNTWYEITTYEKFAKEIRKFEREEDLEDFMSNKAFYIDEAQGVPSLKDIRNTDSLPTTIEQAKILREQRTARFVQRETQRGRNVEDTDKGETIYETIWRAFHKGKRNKIVLATATPMINTPNDIIELINLILPLNHQMARVSPDPPEQQEAFANQSLDYFEPYFRGRVSYVKAAATGIQEQPMGDQLQGYYTRIYACYMSPFQYAAYIRAQQNVDPENRESFYRNQQYASNFVFPDGTFGTDAFDKYIMHANGQYFFRDTSEGQLCKRMVGTPGGLYALSAKYQNIVNICSQSYARSLPVTDDNLGTVFIYFPEFVHGSGAIVLGMCLKENGYEEFTETTNIFVGSQTKNLGRNYGPCASAEEEQGERDARIPKRKRYAILTGSTPPARITAIFNTLNSYENRYGEYLQVVIGSRTAREGINITNAVKMIMASSSWNHSYNTQAKDRVFRTDSLVSRISEKRDRMNQQGLSTDDLTFEIETYNMASVYEPLPQDDMARFMQFLQQFGLNMANYTQLNEANFNTVDPQMYARAEQKDRLIKKVIRYMKQSAVDCYLNRARNIRSTDEDYTPDCDYLPCDYECAGIREELLKPLSRTNKILYYSDQEVDQAMNILRQIFSRFHSLRLEQIHKMVNNFDSSLETIFVDMAIQKMIKENIQLLDRMGFFSYVRESKTGVIYLEKDPFEIEPHPESTAYSSVLVGTQNTSSNTFADYVTEVNIISEEPLVQQLAELDPSSDEFVQALEQLSIASKIILLEKSLYDYTVKQETNDFYSAIMAAYNYIVFRVPEPVETLRETAIKLSNRGKNRGRKPNPNKQPNLKKFTFEEGFALPRFDPTKQAETIILHTLYNQAANNGTSYAAVTRYRKAEGQIRILKPSEGVGWRDVEAHEEIVYNHMIKGQIDQIRSYYEQFPIYGIMLPPNNEFRIRDRENENTVEDDARTVYDGRICKFWKKPYLIDILYRLGIRFEQPVPPNITREEIITMLQSKSNNINWNMMDNDKLLQFYFWYNTNMNRVSLCSKIKQHLEQTGRLLTGQKPPTFGQQGMAAGPTSGSIGVSPSLSTPDYAQSFNMPTAVPPEIPSQILPQFAASAGQNVGQVNQITQIPTDQMYNIPQSDAQISQPPSEPNQVQFEANIDLSSNVGPQEAMGLGSLQAESTSGIPQ